MFCLDTTNSYKYSYVVPIESNRDHKLSPFTVSVSKLATLSSQLDDNDACVDSSRHVVQLTGGGRAA